MNFDETHDFSIEPDDEPGFNPVAHRPRNTGGTMEAALRANPRVSLWLADRLGVEAGKILLRLASLPDLQRMAIMPDVHPSADVCVGSVLATGDLVFPQAIGGDIGCGMAAVRLAGVAGAALHSHDRERILAEFARRVDVMVRTRDPDSTRATPPDPEALSAGSLRASARRTCMPQLGTLGRGNHFVELQRDEADQLWLMVHSGSRAVGQMVATHYTRIAQREGVRAALFGLSRDAEAGQCYVRDQEWCVRYAAANRAFLLSAAAKAVRSVTDAKVDWSSLIDVPHNLVRLEQHEGRECVVHRKGAAPAPAGALGLIPGSAGTFSVHVEGRGEPRALCSSSHGAGRVLSRHDARATITKSDLKRQMGNVTFDIERAQGLRDEAPRAYRDLRDVLRAQTDLVRVVRTLTPLVSFKAGG